MSLLNITEEDIINQISKIRRNNNECWMAILKLAFKEAPIKAKTIFKQITKNDKKINDLSRKLCE